MYQFANLLRLNKPIGIFLLFWPCAWSLAMTQWYVVNNYLFIKYLILFFVGAPLGAIIRKGGIGLPMVVSLILFLSYHFIGTFSRNAAEDGSIDALIGSIIPNAIMLPLGLYLIYRASSDKSIFNFDKISYPFRLFLKKISSIKFRLKK